MRIVAQVLTLWLAVALIAFAPAAESCGADAGCEAAPTRRDCCPSDRPCDCAVSMPAPPSSVPRQVAPMVLPALPVSVAPLAPARAVAGLAALGNGLPATAIWIAASGGPPLYARSHAFLI